MPCRRPRAREMCVIFSWLPAVSASRSRFTALMTGIAESGWPIPCQLDRTGYGAARMMGRGVAYRIAWLTRHRDSSQMVPTQRPHDRDVDHILPESCHCRLTPRARLNDNAQSRPTPHSSTPLACDTTPDAQSAGASEMRPSRRPEGAPRSRMLGHDTVILAGRGTCMPDHHTVEATG
jgi:hypothetical protein